MTSLLGQRIGHFRVVDLVGAGGMGEVYAGWDEKLERRVALKSIKADHRLNATAQARFLREARVLSQLQHPNICQIYDYIEGSDTDILVLELIHGRRLSEALKKGFTFRQKLDAAHQIARVLVAAHEKGIIHRDLKPDNVMLDDDDQVKVLDFGLSGSHLDEDTLPHSALHAESVPRPLQDPSPVDSSGSITNTGQIMGTVGYMSPEQARGEPATTASDMYSLGLLLQELFTGKPPYEQGLPPRELLEKAQVGESRPVEGTDPDVTGLINRLKSLAPAARPSAVDAAERIQWVIDKPVRRLKRITIAAAIVILALFGLFMTMQTIRARRAERVAALARESSDRAEALARKEAAASKGVTDFLVDMFREVDPYRAEGGGADMTARQLLDRGVDKINRELSGQPEIRARLLDTMGTVYQRLGAFDQAQSLVEQGLEIRQATLPPEHLDIASSLYSFGRLYGDRGQYEKAVPLLKKSLAIREKALGPDHPDVAAGLSALGSLYTAMGRFSEAEPLLRRGLAIREKAFGPNGVEVADSLNRLAALCFRMGRNGEAETLFQRQLEINEKAFGPNHPYVLKSVNNLGAVYFNTGRYEEAEPYFKRALEISEKVLGPEHPDRVYYMSNLATIYFYADRYDEAEQLYRRSIEIRTKALGPSHTLVAGSLHNLADVFMERKRYGEAESLFRRSLQIFETAFGPVHSDVAYSLNGLASAVAYQGRYAEAEQLFSRALGIYETRLDPDHPETAEAFFDYGRMKAARGDEAAALKLLSRSLAGGADQQFMKSIRKDYASLAGNPEFEKIASQVEARQKVKR